MTALVGKAATVSELRPNAWVVQEMGRIKAALAEVRTVLDADGLSRRAYALAELAERARLSSTIKLEAAETVVRCERALGLAMRTAPERRGGDRSKTSAADVLPKKQTLKNLGIHERRADQCRQLSAIADDKFEAIITNAKRKADENPERATRSLSIRAVVGEVRNELSTKTSTYSPTIKPTDNWNFFKNEYLKFEIETGAQGKESHGYIPGEFYANCLWYYTKPGDVVVEPMAGSGMIWHVWEDRDRWMAPSPWDLNIMAFDLTPRGPFADRITQHDLRTGFPVSHADYVVMDVPYFGMVKGQYSSRDNDLANMALDEWAGSIEAIARSCAASQKPDGLCTVLAPNFRDVSKGQIIMTTEIIREAFKRSGYVLHDLAYASRRIQQQQNPSMQKSNEAAKRNRVMLTDMAEVQTFRRI